MKVKIMEKRILTIGSLTHTIKGQELLLRAGISAQVKKLSPQQDTNGCSQGLEIYRSDLDNALHILNESGIRVTHIRGGGL